MQTLAQPISPADYFHLFIIAIGSVYFVLHACNFIFLLNDQLGRLYSFIVTDTANREIAKREPFQ